MPTSEGASYRALMVPTKCPEHEMPLQYLCSEEDVPVCCTCLLVGKLFAMYPLVTETRKAQARTRFTLQTTCQCS